MTIVEGGPEAVDLIVSADFLYPVDGVNDVVLSGEVAVRDGRIVYAGSEKPAGSWIAKAG